MRHGRGERESHALQRHVVTRARRPQDGVRRECFRRFILAHVLETVLAGQSYSITIKATDASGSSSQTIVEVTVTPGPNIRPPYFDKLVYDVQVTQN